MANLLATELRRTEPSPYLAPNLKRYVATQYAEEPDQYADDFRNLELIRNDVVLADATEAGLKKLWRYYFQLANVTLKFPGDEVNLKVPFTWTTLYTKDKRSVQGYGLNYDRLLLLHNIAALYSIVGVSEYKMTTEGVKRSSQSFQAAAGIFAKIKEDMAGKVNPPPEMTESSVACWEQVMLAQAQECFWAKAVIDKLKDGTIAKLAAKVSDFYSAAASLASQAKLPATIIAHLTVKSLHFDAASQYRQSLVAGSEAKYGEEIARLRHAMATTAKANDKETQKNCTPAVLADLKALIEKTAERLAAAEKDNNVIYVQRIPPMDQLAAIGRAQMAKAADFPPSLPDGSQPKDLAQPPLFERLVPFAVHRALSVYSAKRDDLINGEDRRLRSSTEAAWAALASLNLPGAIEAMEQPIGLPQTLIDRSVEVRSQGGARALEESWGTLSALAEKDASLLAEATRNLDEEAESDAAVRAHYGTRWTRAASAELAANLRETARAYADKLEQARKSDALVRSKLDRYLPGIMALDGSREQLEASVPTAHPSTAPGKHDSSATLLKAQMAQLGSIIAARQGIIDRMRSEAKADGATPMLEMYSRGEPIEGDKAVDSLLKRYDALRDEANKSLEAQATMLDSIRKTYEQFSKAKSNNPMLLDRERALQNLDTAYKAFKDISSNLSEGTKFYHDFSPVLSRFAESCKDFAFARKVDMQEALRAMTSSIASLRLSSEALSPVPGGFSASPLSPSAPPIPSAPSAPPVPDRNSSYSGMFAAPGAFPDEQGPPPYSAPPGSFNPTWGGDDKK